MSAIEHHLTRKICWFAVLALGLLAPAAARAAEPPPDSRGVLAMIEQIKADLLKQQKPDGSWEDPSWDLATRAGIGGHTALVTWALLQAGVDPHSEPIIKAARHLLSLDMLGTYNRSLRCMVMASLARIDPHGRYAGAMRADVDFLLKSRLGNGRWTYIPMGAQASGGVRSPDMQGLGDNSNTQFAILALREAAVAGAAIPASFWNEVRSYWQAEQLPSGGFEYRGQPRLSGTAYGSMTGAGTASLFICEDMLRGGRCCVGELPEPIGLALGWLSENFSATENPKGPRWWSYWLYSVERVAETSGYRTFGPHDWFWEGAAAIADRMGSEFGGLQDIGEARLAGSAFALIFLAKGAAPLVLNKLQFGDGWNPNPLDATHVTRYLAADVFERHLNWLTIPLEAPLAMFHEAPILLITSKTWPGADAEIRPKLHDLLRTFCETGGTLLVDHTCSPDSAFMRDFSGFLEEVWPGRPLKPLEADHLLYRAHYPMTDQLVPLQGLGNGCREYVIVSSSTDETTDLSCVWHRGLIREQQKYFQLAANLYMYATDKSFRMRLEPRSQIPRRSEPAARRLAVARVMHTNNPDPCPLALPMLSQAMAARAEVGLDIATLAIGQPRAPGRKVLVISGQGRLDWTPEQIALVRDHVKGGGMVLGDALMGDPDFAESLRKLAATALQAAPRPVPDNDPLMTGAFAPGQAWDLRRVHYSRALRWRRGVRGPAVLEGCRAGDRWAFLVSPYDLTNGLTTARPYALLGYEPDDATRIAANCMLYFAGSATPILPAPPPPLVR